MLRRVMPIGLVALVASACGTDSVTGERFVVRDSADIQLASSAAPRLPQTVVVDPDPVMVVPAEFGAPEHVLFNARYAALLTDGRVVVGNAGTNQLFFFSPAGEFLEAFGGPGDGPGEFQRFFGLHECGDDRLVVEELSRMSLIRGRTAEFERNVQISGHLAAGRGVIGGVDQGCSAALMVDQAPPTIEASNRVFDSSVTLYWADLETGARDSLGTFPGTELYPWEMRGRPAPIRAPFGRNAVWTVHADGVVFGSARDVSFQLLGDGGQLLRVVRWGAPPLSVADQEWEDFERSREDFVRQNPEEADLQPPRGYLPRPEEKPPYAALRVDQSERIWVRSYGGYSVYGPEPSSVWWVFTPEGEWVAEVRMPDGLEVLTIGDSTLVGVVRDEFDLEQVQLHRFSLEGRG